MDFIKWIINSLNKKTFFFRDIKNVETRNKLKESQDFLFIGK